MGIIGWADAPNSIENSSSTASFIAKTATSGNNRRIQDNGVETPDNSNPPAIVETPSTIQDSLNNVPENAFDDTEEVNLEKQAEEQNPRETDMGSNEDDNGNEGTTAINKTVFEQLIETIRGLKLRQSTDCPVGGSVHTSYDISKLELHEVEFLINHAQRVENVDFFTVVREVHAVKRRILDVADTPDDVVSENLDFLMDLVENKYNEALAESF